MAESPGPGFAARLYARFSERLVSTPAPTFSRLAIDDAPRYHDHSDWSTFPKYTEPTTIAGRRRSLRQIFPRLAPGCLNWEPPPVIYVTNQGLCYSFFEKKTML